MDKDREELEKILEDNRMCVPQAGSWNWLETHFKFIDDLLRWKRGEKYWCEHMNGLKIVERLGWYTEDGSSVREIKQLYCPACGAKRPE